jgi:hypothetical protein
MGALVEGRKMMSTRRFLLLGVLVPALLMGCTRGGDVDVGVYVEEQLTATFPPQPILSSVVPVPTVVPPELTTLLEESVALTATLQQPAAASEPAPLETPTGQPVSPSGASPTGLLVEPTVKPVATSSTEMPSATVEETAIAGEEYTFDPASWAESLVSLSSFRQKVVLGFASDGTDVQGRAVYDSEVTTDPSALHSTLRIEGQAAVQLPLDQVEVVWTGDQAWVKMGPKPWFQVPVASLESEYAGQVVGVGDLLPFIQRALRIMPDGAVNGIPCKHYSYDINNLQADAGMSSAEGDIWVAKDGGYVVRLTMKGQGTYYGTYTSSGSLDLVYDLYDLNVPISIRPPR